MSVQIEIVCPIVSANCCCKLEKK
uniref:Uncharacterized protein n=1 Tax=Rhizophora mucronata TaxID=61149 RepID=A0A2P2PL67_RHIMU